MDHLRKGRKFGRERDQRHALLRSVASAFFIHGKIRTTEAKAKEVRILIERSITRGKSPTLANRRFLLRSFSSDTVKKIFVMSERYQSRPGGYTRIIKLEPRRSDSARMALLESV